MGVWEGVRYGRWVTHYSITALQHSSTAAQHYSIHALHTCAAKCVI
jgi:hypothetical protein